MLYRLSAWVFAMTTLLLPLFTFLWTKQLYDEIPVLQFENIFATAAVVVWIPVHVYTFYAAWVLTTRRTPLSVLLDRTVSFLWYCAAVSVAVPTVFSMIHNVGNLWGMWSVVAPATFALTAIGFIKAYRNHVPAGGSGPAPAQELAHGELSLSA